MGAITHISKRFSDELVGSKMAPTSYQGWKANVMAAQERSKRLAGGNQRNPYHMQGLREDGSGQLATDQDVQS